MDAGQKGLMKGLIKTGLVFSAVLVAALMIFYVLPVFAGPGITLTRVAPSPANASNVSTVGTQGYFFVNFTSNESFVSIPILEVTNVSTSGVGSFPMTRNGTDATANYSSFNVTGLGNGTFAWRIAGVNTSSLGANQTFGNFTVTLGQIYNKVITNPGSGTTTNDVTPELRISANSTFLTNLSLAFYTSKAGVVQAIVNTTILNGTETYFNLTTLSNGTYTVTAELGNSADFKVNSTAITLTVRHLEANASVNVASVNAGAKQNYTFTITNNGTDDNTDSIDMINISYSAPGYADPAAGDIVCPTTTSLWNRSVDGNVKSIICLLPGPDDTKINPGVSKTILVENWSATNTGGLKLFSVVVRGSIGGGTTTVSNSPSTSVYGNLSITGTNRVASYTRLGSTNVTIISFNFSATGEQVNISEIIVTRNGTVTNADIVSVALYNSTKENAQTFNETGRIDPLAVNTSAPVNGRYNFSNLGFNVSSSQILIIVFNISSSATGGNTFNASIEGAADVVTTGGASAQAITETFATQRSSSSTLSALSITGTSRVASTTVIGTGNVTIISFNFTATGEAMNITGLNITLNGTQTTSDIVRVGLYNSSAAEAGVLDGSGVNYNLIQWNTSAPLNGRYNFSNIGFNVSVGTNVLLVVINVSSSATGGRTFNASIEGAADVVASGGVSGLSVTPTFASQRSGSSTIYGNLSITGASRVASYTRLGSTNVTVISFNFTATGEQMNISQITITRTGTVSDADVVSVALYNSTRAEAGIFNGTDAYDLIRWNTSVPSSGAYTFSSLGFNVSSGTTNVLLVVINVSSTATGGGVFGAGITSAASVTTTSGASGQSITETLATQISGNSTLSALAVTGGTLAPSTISVGQSAKGFLNLTFAATGETMNITSINITLTGNGTALNLSNVRIYRDEATAPGRFDSSDTLISIGAFNGNSVQLNLTPNIYNVSISIGTTVFFVTYNVSAIALNGSTVGAQMTPSGLAAVGNTSGLGISVTGNSIASSNATIQSQARLTFSTITSTAAWIMNGTTGPNSTTITVPVTNAGHATANLTSVVATMYNAVTAENASTNFTITRADSVTSVSGGVTTTLNFTINATTASQLNGLVNVSVTLLYNDSNTLVASANSPTETNTSGLFGLDSTVPTSQIVLPSNNLFLKGTQDVNFTLNDTASGVNSSSLVFQVNGTTRTATCSPSGLNFTCNFSWATSGGSYSDGVYKLIVNVSDNATNAAARSEVNVTVDNTAPAFSGDNVTVSLINTTLTTVFSVNITERNFNASKTFIGVRNLTNATVRNFAATCSNVATNVWNCNATWNGKDDSAANVADGNYTFTANSTDNASAYGAFNSTTVVVFTSDTTPPSVTWSGPNGTITSTTPALLVNTTESATCKWDTADMSYSIMSNTFTGTGLTHNYTLSSQTDGRKSFSVRCQDTIGNVMTASSGILFEINTAGNFNFTSPNSGYFTKGLKTMTIPIQSEMERFGKNATNTGNFNFTSVLDSLGTSWSYMYYNINGTSAGWVLATRTDPGGSTLKYVNNTNIGETYLINITADNARFTL
ncbi:MAG: hypothetical protein WC613_04105 [Candidatus Aenigmatarchaeota archaeon]